MQTNKILRGVIIGGIFLIPFICLIVYNHFFFPFITGKNFAFRILVEIITGLWIILALRDKTVLPKISRLLQVFAVFVGVMFVADLLSPNVYKSLWSNYERMEGFVTLAHLFALFVVLTSMMTKRLWEWIFRVSIGVSLILFVYGLFQLIGSSKWFSVNAPGIYSYFHQNYPIHQGSTRIDTTMGNSAYLGGYMLFHAFIALYFFCVYLKNELGKHSFNLFWPIVYGFAFLADTFIIIETATRGSEIGFAVGLLCLGAGLAFFEKENKKLRRVGIGILFAIVLLGGLFFVERKSDFVVRNESLSRLASFVDQLSTFDKKVICEGELKSRCLLWPMAFQGVKERPILGWGQESFNYVFNKYYDPKMYSQEQWFDRTHNVFFDWLIAGGVLGLLSYLSLFAFSLYTLWKKGSAFSVLERSLLTGLFAGYFFHNLTVFDNLTSYIMFVLVLAWIDSSEGVASRKVGEKISSLDVVTRDRVLTPIVSVATILLIYAVNVPSMLASSELISALSASPGGPAVNLEHYKKAFSYGGFGDSEIREQLAQTTTQAASVQGIDPKIRAGFFNLTKEQMEKQLELTPQDTRYFLFAGSFLSSFGDYDNGIKYLKKAHELSPKKQTILFTLGTVYLGKGDVPSALETLKKAYDIEPAFSDARLMYGLALVYAKDGKKAGEILQTLPLYAILGDQRFLQAFLATGYIEQALASINFMIEREPTNVQNLFTRAAIYYQTGKVSAATADLKKAGELNPAIKEQADKFIGQMREGKAI